MIRGAFFLRAFFRAPNGKCSKLNAREPYQLFRSYYYDKTNGIMTFEISNLLVSNTGI